MLWNRKASTSLLPRLCLFIESIDSQNQWAAMAGGREHLLFPRHVLIKSRPPKFGASIFLGRGIDSDKGTRHNQIATQLGVEVQALYSRILVHLSTAINVL